MTYRDAALLGGESQSETKFGSDKSLLADRSRCLRPVNTVQLVPIIFGVSKLTFDKNMVFS